MVLLEGVDCVGKTTAALGARDLLGRWSYRHQSEPTGAGGPLVQALTLLADAHPRLLVDRLHLSEFAYGLAVRGECRLTPHQWRLVELALLSRNCSVAWLVDSPDAVRARWDARRELYPIDLMKSVAAHYEAAFGERDLAYLDPAQARRTRLPWSQFTLIELLARLPDLAATWEKRAQAVAGLPVPSLGIGSPRPEFVVVGEGWAPGAPAKGGAFSEVDLPFARGPAAEWLWRALDEAGCRWWEGYYTNACAWQPVEFGWLVTRALGAARGQRRVVLLGERAKELFDRAAASGWLRGVTYSTVWHPSFVRRFRHRQYCQWRSELAQALAPHCRELEWALEHSGDRDEWDLRCSEDADGID